MSIAAFQAKALASLCFPRLLLNFFFFAQLYSGKEPYVFSLHGPTPLAVGYVFPLRLQTCWVLPALRLVLGGWFHHSSFLWNSHRSCGKNSHFVMRRELYFAWTQTAAR
eukprot:RCo026881